MNALNTLVRPGTSGRPSPDGTSGEGTAEHTADTSGAAANTAADTAARGERVTGAATSGASGGQDARTGAAARVRDADGMAVASFVLGLAGLLVFNLVLGPCALVLGGLALLRGTARRGRAALGISLGAADLVVLAVVTAADQSVSWSIAG